MLSEDGKENWYVGIFIGISLERLKFCIDENISKYRHFSFPCLSYENNKSAIKVICIL